MNIYVKNNLNGIIHRVGDDRHDSLIIEDGKLSYYNLQCGEGTRFGGYSFCDKNGNTDFDNDCYDNYYPIDLDSIEKELLIKNQNLEKVIEIIKSKANIRLHILTNTDGSKIYEIEFIFTYYSTIHEITQKEYDLLKELLENGGN